MYKSTVYGETKEYELELEMLVDDETGREYLEVTTWGYDYEVISIPITRVELCNLKVRCQMYLPGDGPNQVALRYYFSILRYEQDGHFGW